jgi:hypothetical protein
MVVKIVGVGYKAVWKQEPKLLEGFADFGDGEHHRIPWLTTTGPRSRPKLREAWKVSQQLCLSTLVVLKSNGRTSIGRE